MNTYRNRLFCCLITASLCVFVGVGTALASSNSVTQAKDPTQSRPEPQRSCLSPLVLAVGGVCCPGPQSSMAPCLVSNPGGLSANAKKLKPIFVSGVKLPLPIVLQMLSKSLERSWSKALSDRADLVCRYRKSLNAGAPFLHCSTNNAHFHLGVEALYHIKPTNVKIQCYANCFITRGNVMISVLRYVNNNSTRARLLGSLLKGAPTANSSYSLRVAQTVPLKFPVGYGWIALNYPVFVKFIISKGDIAGIELMQRHGLAQKWDRKKQNRLPEQIAPNSSPDPWILCVAGNVIC
ncbi:MAG: hypothetical protein ACRETC_00735 [Gammaproteobacteria bacterium]